MNSKLVGLVSGLALIAGVGVANASELPDLLNSAAYEPMSNNEMAQVTGTAAISSALSGALAEAAGVWYVETYTNTGTYTVALSAPLLSIAKAGSFAASGARAF